MNNDEGTNLKSGESANPGGTSESTRTRLAARTAKKEGVKKGVLTTAIFCFLLLVTGGIVVNSVYKDEQKKHLSMMENQKRAFTEQLTTRDSVINETMLTFDEIEKNLSLVKEKENVITIKSADKEFSKDKKQLILKDIEFINALLDQNKKKISSLTAQ